VDYTSAGNYPNNNGVSIFPGLTTTGPLIAGNVVASDGTGNLAGLGETTGTANTGTAVLSQSQAGILQSGTPVTTNIVIPAQSQITRITVMVTTALTGAATTLGLGTSASATALTAANAIVTSGALGQVSVVPGTGATQIGNWDNTGTKDIQVVVTFTNTGSGVITLTVEYAQGINLAS